MAEYTTPDLRKTIERLADPECRDVPAHVRRAARQVLATVAALNAADWCAWCAKHRDEIDTGDSMTAPEFEIASRAHLISAYRKA